MAKKSIIARQKKRENLVRLNWERRAELRERSKNVRLTEEERSAARTALNKMRRDTSYVRLKNRCALSGRGHAFIRKFQLSRICFRELASHGAIPGVTKASW